MTKFYSYRNVTDNGSIRAVALTEAQVEKKLAELRTQHPNTVFEKVEVKVASQKKTEWVTGNGRAGNSYRASWNVKTIKKV